MVPPLSLGLVPELLSDTFQHYRLRAAAAIAGDLEAGAADACGRGFERHTDGTTGSAIEGCPTSVIGDGEVSFRSRFRDAGEGHRRSAVVSDRNVERATGGAHRDRSVI